MKIMITGAQGQLGQEIVKDFSENHEVFGFNSSDLDVTNLESIHTHMNRLKPHIIVNCASYNMVDDAELNPDGAQRVNEVGPKNIAEISRHLGTVMVHFSTDFVFDGKSKVPYDEKSSTGPINVYGQTKLAGEQHVQHICDKHIVLRTSWLYGSSKKNFFNSIVDASRKQQAISVVDDQIGCPTYIPDLVRQLKFVIDEGIFGLYHCSGNGFCSRYEFAKQILDLMRIETEIHPVQTLDYPHKAIRPQFSALNNYALEKCINRKMPHWEQSLIEYVNKIN